MRRCRRQIVQLGVIRFVDNLSAGCIASCIEILRDRCLAVGHHPLAGVFLRVDEKAGPPLPRDRRTVVRMAFPIHALPETDGAQQVDGACLQCTGANSLQHMLSGLPF